MKFFRTIFFFFLCFSLVIFIGVGTGIAAKATHVVSTLGLCNALKAQSRPQATVHYSQSNPAPTMPILTWSKTAGAVSYELELLKHPPTNLDLPDTTPNRIYSTTKIFVAGYQVDGTGLNDTTFFWRVRGLDVNSKPLSPFSSVEKVVMDKSSSSLSKPLLTSVFNQSPGDVLLYPVYSWIPIANATAYEVEILDAPPENPNGTTPSIHRLDAAIATGFDYYDEKPRISDTPLYWRVRGLDSNGEPVGIYSDVGSFTVSPAAHYRIATYGDSITHGGGSISYPPSAWEYSYQHYLNFPTINLGKSGDTSEALVERFEADVLPFQPDYLIILGGTNSLRGDASAEEVIADLKTLKEKCLTSGIQPVFLTLPPINPEHIKKVFNETTSPEWQDKFRLVNQFIRTQNHIDIAHDIDTVHGILAPFLAVDGLHLDIEGKKKIANRINLQWKQVAQTKFTLQ